MTAIAKITKRSTIIERAEQDDRRIQVNQTEVATALRGKAAPGPRRSVMSQAADCQSRSER